MTYKLFIDDERYPVTPDWFIARNSYDAIYAVKEYGLPSEIADKRIKDAQCSKT